jgi:GntR family transcriptional repressor for pyruvate dehydrogenase complex
VIHRSLISMMMLTSQQVDRDHTLAFHEAIFESIRARNAGDAERHMCDHLIDARSLLLQAQQKEAKERLRKSISQQSGGKQRALRRSAKG